MYKKIKLLCKKKNKFFSRALYIGKTCVLGISGVDHRSVAYEQGHDHWYDIGVPAVGFRDQEHVPIASGRVGHVRGDRQRFQKRGGVRGHRGRGRRARHAADIHPTRNNSASA